MKPTKEEIAEIVREHVRLYAIPKDVDFTRPLGEYLDSIDFVCISDDLNRILFCDLDEVFERIDIHDARETADELTEMIYGHLSKQEE